MFQAFFPRVMIMYLIAASAFMFYITKIPERYFPGVLSFKLTSILEDYLLFIWAFG